MPGYQLPQRGLVSQQDQAMIERPDVPRSKFTGKWTRKTTFDAGYLIPFMVDEVLPGDHMSYNVHAMLRMATPLFPLFDNQRIDTFFFFVPCRLLWSHWVNFMGEQLTPSDSISYTVPQIVSPTGGFAVGSIFDHMGVPVAGQTNAAATISINAMPLRAYRLIYQQWFRDENLVDAGGPITGDGPDSYTLYGVYTRAKSHDYFTSCLPWPQKFQAPTIPLSGSAPITGLGTVSQNFSSGPLSVVETAPGGTTNYGFYAYSSAANNLAVLGSAASGGRPQIFANLAAVAGIGLNALRQSWLVQQLLERDARGGTRYTEIVRSHFGVVSPDARLQRAEYIGGGSSPLQVTPVAQTAPVVSNGVVGSLGAAATSFGQHRATYAAVEHGYILGLINVRSDLSYQQGLHKLWSRSTRYDFYFPSFAGLGEQAVLTQEIYSTGLAGDQTVFGYQERWQEYRTRYSEVTGLFRSTSAGTIDGWHLAQKFTSAPVLDGTFIADTPPMSRVLATASTNQQYLADILIERTAVRPMPVYGVPVRIGRF